jgi:hypothetical protein
MIKNPERDSRGGDVEGTEKIDMTGAVGAACDVASASFEPGYDDLALGYSTMADVKRGFMSYGVGVGDKRGKGYI